MGATLLMHTPPPRRRPSARRTALLGVLILGVVGLAVTGALEASAIGRSTSSTAAIGYLFLPFSALLRGGLPGALGGLCFGYLLSKQKRGTRGSRRLTLLAGATLLALTGAAAIVFVRGITRTEDVRRASVQDPAAIQATLDSPLGQDPFVLAAIALNPATTLAQLHQIALRDDPALHQPMGSLFDVMGANRKGLAVMRLVARHRNVGAETLELLATSPSDAVRADVASNPKLGERSLAELASAGPRTPGDFSLELGLSSNPATPPEVLARLSRHRSEYVRAGVAGNPSTRREQLVQLGLDPVWIVRQRIADNPSTPDEVFESLRNDPDRRVRPSRSALIRRGKP